MMRLEINNKNETINEVLIDIPFGKKNILDETIVDQSPQKEDTCWYYTFNYLRVRYGKSIPSDHPARKIEIAVSAHRKRKTDIDKRSRFYRSYLLNKFSAEENITRKEAKIFLDNFDKDFFEQFSLGKKNTIEIKKLLKAFLSQNKIDSLKSFIDETKMEDAIKSIIRLFEALKSDYPSRQQGQSIIEHRNNLDIALKMELAKQYGLVFSSWVPKDGITGLIDALRTKGACYISAYCGTPFYVNEPHQLAEVFGKRKVYGWNKGEYFKDENEHGGHAILLVGAKKCKNQEHVYFIDPNDSNSINGENKIYKISYSRLISTLRNFIGNPFDSYMGSYGPYLCHANPNIGVKMNAHIDEVKKSLKTYSKNLTPASLTLFKSKPVSEMTPADLVPNGGLSFDRDLDYANLSPKHIPMFLYKASQNSVIPSDDTEDDNLIETKSKYSQLTPASLTLFQYKKASDLNPADLAHHGGRVDLSHISPADLDRVSIAYKMN